MTHGSVATLVTSLWNFNFPFPPAAIDNNLEVYSLQGLKNTGTGVSSPSPFFFCLASHSSNILSNAAEPWCSEGGSCYATFPYSDFGSLFADHKVNLLFHKSGGSDYELLPPPGIQSLLLPSHP